MLTTTQIATTDPPSPGKQKKLFDGDGLYLLLYPNGKKGWRLKFRFAGRESTLSFGPYPEIPIEVARERTKAAREQLRRGENPAAEKRAAREASFTAAENTFGKVGMRYLQKERGNPKRRPKTHKQNARYFHHLAKFHAWPLDSIKTVDLSRLCDVLETKGNIETAHRIASFACRVFNFAAQKGLTDRNPAIALRGGLRAVPTKSRHGLTDPKEFGGLIRAIDGYPQITVRNALQLLARTFVRPGELRHAEWSQFKLDGEAPEWNIPAEQMKMRRPHWVPLASQCVVILKQQRQISGDGRYVFPNGRSGSNRPMSDGAMGAALKWLCFAHDGVVPHGFRVSASTLLHELGFDPKIIEAQLAHENLDQVAKVYNRAVYLPERRAMMERWCSYIEELKTPAKPGSED